MVLQAYQSRKRYQGYVLDNLQKIPRVRIIILPRTPEGSENYGIIYGIEEKRIRAYIKGFTYLLATFLILGSGVVDTVIPSSTPSRTPMS